MGCVVVSADVGGVREVFDGMSIEEEVSPRDAHESVE